ncbi:hypothetical protein MBSD_n1654 [Mizugakiibacter sediminis]|uniref:Uncharacterized protein n=1 Tax=Mizugakiibacter sediminis TaxID=1475481 RepID=A0A0K8QPK8_9GAMM|nr:hypothetical protein [Mizugakiibacter sediminis]GAP66347.1 hypothetical protein MBSD_n1654 [Mizugakiibacter sediminis]
MKIDLHIERLVLDGALLGGERAADVRAALQRELARQLAAPGALDALRGLGAVDALPPLPLKQARHAHDRLGGRIAAAVGQGLGIAAAAAPSPRPATGAGKE